MATTIAASRWPMLGLHDEAFAATTRLKSIRICRAYVQSRATYLARGPTPTAARRLLPRARISAQVSPKQVGERAPGALTWACFREGWKNYECAVCKEETAVHRLNFSSSPLVLGMKRCRADDPACIRAWARDTFPLRPLRPVAGPSWRKECWRCSLRKNSSWRLRLAGIFSREKSCLFRFALPQMSLPLAFAPSLPPARRNPYIPGRRLASPGENKLGVGAHVWARCRALRSGSPGLHCYAYQPRNRSIA